MLDVAKKMLSVLDQQLVALEKQARTPPLEQAARGMHYVYISDSNGLIQLDQDADFVVEQMLVSKSWAWFSMEELGSGRSLTLSAIPVDLSDPSAGMKDSFFVPGDVVPRLEQGTYDVINNVDYWFDLPAEWLLARGGAVQFRWALNVNQTTNPLFILSGYKLVR